jgi:hypothetical protein
MRVHPSQRRVAGLPFSALFLAVVVASSLLAPAAASAAFQGSSRPPTSRAIVVVLSPFLTWNDLSPARTPNLWSLAENGAVGNMNSITNDLGWPTAAGGALTLSASRWAAGPIGSAAEPSNLAAARAANADSLAPPDLGALGAVIRESGLKTAAVGNGDEDTSTPGGVRRPAGLAATDRLGRIDNNFTAPALLDSDASAPFGVRANPARLRAGIAIAMLDKPALLVVDPGDLERAHDAPNQTAEQAAASHTAAVAGLDQAVGDLRSMLGTQAAMVMVVTAATDKPFYEPPYFGPTIVWGGDMSGDLSSPSTQRPGLVANLDVAPTVLSVLGLSPTKTMLGQRMNSRSTSAPLADRIGRLSSLGTSVGAVDYLRDLLLARWFAYASALIALLAAALALLPFRRIRVVGRLAILAALSVPSAAWLMFALNRHPTSPQAAWQAFLIAGVLVFAVAAALSFVPKFPAETPVFLLGSLTSLLIAADQWSGRPLETGLFSYSIRAGWRYYGVGNEGAALLVGASIAAAGIACDWAAGGRWAKMMQFGLLPVVGAVVLVTLAAPFAGANAGVAVWGVVAFAVAWMRVNHLRLSPKRLGILALGIVVLIAAFVALDALRGSGETHLARFFGGAASGDLSGVWQLVYRKALNNYNYIPKTAYTWLAVGIAAALGMVAFVGRKPLGRALHDRPGLSAALVGVLAGSVAALLTEDSGIVMPALMLFAGAMPALYVALLPSEPSSASAE